jgi:processive 1,2-diacylglycerol beta-glucosyltransferase
MKQSRKKKMLILSGTFGNGHQQVAKAISDASPLCIPDTEPVVVDVFEWLHPYLNSFSRYAYMKSIQTFPKLYGYLYQKTRYHNSFSIKMNQLLSSGAKKLLDLLKELQPSIVVSTFPFAAAMIAKLKEDHLTDIPSITVITDHTDHSFWIYPYTDCYLVGSQWVKNQLVQSGVEPQKIRVTGIPVHPKFQKPYRQQELRVKYKLKENLPTILVMGGGDGLIGEGLLTPYALDSIPEPLQFIIVCGRNKRLEDQLRNQLVSTKHSITVIGYTEFVHELMAISDIIITKPGGVTTAEAAAMELPILLYKPLPGQEQDNAAYLTEKGAAVEAASQEELFNHIQRLVSDSLFLKDMKKRAGTLGNKAAVFQALTIINQCMVNRPFFISELLKQDYKWEPYTTPSKKVISYNRSQL